MGISSARALGVIKVLVGGACVASPGLATQWVGRDGESDGAKALTRMFGIRDAAFGAGLVVAPNEDGSLRRWLLLSSVCDAIAFAAGLTLPASRGRNGLLLAAAGATVTQLALAAQAD